MPSRSSPLKNAGSDMARLSSVRSNQRVRLLLKCERCSQTLVSRYGRRMSNLPCELVCWDRGVGPLPLERPSAAEPRARPSASTFLQSVAIAAQVRDSGPTQHSSIRVRTPHKPKGPRLQPWTQRGARQQESATTAISFRVLRGAGEPHC